MRATAAVGGRTTARGFSLLEVLLAAAVLVVSLLPIINLTIANTRKAHFNRDRSLAFMLAAQVLERYRAETFEMLKGTFPGGAATAGPIESDALLSPSAVADAAGWMKLIAPFQRTAAFEVDPAQPRRGRLKAKVEWIREKDQPEAIELSTVVVDREFPVGR